MPQGPSGGPWSTQSYLEEKLTVCYNKQFIMPGKLCSLNRERKTSSRLGQDYY